MAITIELQPEQEERIVIEARKRGLSVEDYLARAIAGEFPMPSLPMTPAEALEEWTREGLLPIWTDIPDDSITLARKLRYGSPERETR